MRLSTQSFRVKRPPPYRTDRCIIQSSPRAIQPPIRCFETRVPVRLRMYV